MDLDLYDEWIVVGVTLIIVFVSVFVHYEGLSRMSRLLNTIQRIDDRHRIMALIFGILVLHSIEIGLFAAGYFMLLLNPIFGALVGLDELTFFECLYFSTISFTTLGFGELVPTDDIRFLSGVESLVGLVLIAWSASFTFLEMQKRWDR
jgi:hypothetical protein